MGGAGAGAGRGAGMMGMAGAVLAVEVCAPLMLLCWLCCWPDDASDSTSGKHPQRPVLAHVHESHSRRRSSDLFGRRIGSSAVSLPMPSTSGYKKSLSAHRSHEEIGRHRKLSVHEVSEPETRYHSAPSVIDEVLHRRDWERSSKDLYIPLKPTEQEVHSADTSSSESPEAPHATPESSSIEAKSEEQLTKPCKKHHTNIKSSKRKKEKTSTDIKDDDATEAEPSNFYIGEHVDEGSPINSKVVEERCDDVHTKSIYKAKDDKQSFNELIRSKERPRQLTMVDERHPLALGFCLDDVIERLDQLDLHESLDRSGAHHHSQESRLSLSSRPVFPPPSVEPVGYDGGACYLAESGELAELRPPAGRGPGRAGPGAGVGAWRARHASDGDILAPPVRPESGAFSESDLDLELEGAEERPPPYDELQQYAQPDHKETAI
ncbi:hypothetical protein PYW07_010652 [Mythimna separata]|uniref:Uncharacterized protein n=1 Tax=Mythimna separata TaxID=271217 RepID=A0AAD7YB08_MYTSE|nr:hypothetical protein PYW07_010652 [Mythimna separata]